jgi:hypothetical protein
MSENMKVTGDAIFAKCEKQAGKGQKHSVKNTPSIILGEADMAQVPSAQKNCRVYFYEFKINLYKYLLTDLRPPPL